MYILSPSAFSIFASIVIELAVVLEIVHPITTVVVELGTVYIVRSVLAPVLPPVSVLSLKVFGIMFP